MRYGVRPVPLRGGLWWKGGGAKVKGAPSIERNEKRNKTLLACCVLGYFPEAEVKKEDCCFSTCQSVFSQATDLPSGLNSVR